MTLTKERKIALDRYRGQLSYGESIKKLLEDKMDPYKQGRADGYTAGFNVGFGKGRTDGYKEGEKDGHSDGESDIFESLEEILEEYGPDSLVRLVSGEPNWI